MKIGIFTNAYKPIISGVVNSIELIKKGLRKLGHKVFIFAPRFSGYRDKEAGVFRFMSVNLTNKIKFPLAIPYDARIFNIIDRLDLDLIHCHHPFILGEVGAWFAKKSGVPLVFTFHTQYEQYTHYIPFPQKLVKKMTRTSVLSYTDKCDLIICPSPNILSLLDDYGVTAPFEMINNAIDLRLFQKPKPAAVRARYGISESDKLLIYVGRMGIEKNIGFMLKAFRNASKEAPNAKLMIVGEGPELSALQEIAGRLEIGDKVIFTGRVEYKEIPNYYAAAYAFIMTSTTEVKPLALLEAMASGLPIVAVAACGSSDTVHEGRDGILTEHDLDKFSGALVKILRDQDLRDRLSIGAKKTSEEYSMDATSKRLENLYVKLIETKKREKIDKTAKREKKAKKVASK